MTKQELLKPVFLKDETVDQFIRRMGIPISIAPIEYHNTIIRIDENVTYYSFKNVLDSHIFDKYLRLNDIYFYRVPHYAINELYEHCIAIYLADELTKPTRKPNKTYYKPQDIDEAIRLVKLLKNITVRSQDYDNSAILRDMERFFMDKLEKDKK